MKHAGRLLKEHIEKNHLVKKQVANAAGITYNYLSTIFKQETMDAALLEKLYVAVGLHPGIVFDVPQEVNKSFSDISAQTEHGNASVKITNGENFREIIEAQKNLIAEKERTIQILMSASNIVVPGQNRDNNNK